MAQSTSWNGFEFKCVSQPEFDSIFEQHGRKIFDEEGIVFRLPDVLSEDERKKNKALSERMGVPLKLFLVAYRDGKLAGWSFGFQESGGNFYMCNSAVLPEFRRVGLYTALMNWVMDWAIEQGFQTIYSRHHADNNAVLIPKLKRGFLLTKFELSDAFGLVVHLTYYVKPLRRKIVEYRTGHQRPDEEVKKALKL